VAAAIATGKAKVKKTEDKEDKTDEKAKTEV
jgi:hypothetical protein